MIPFEMLLLPHIPLRGRILSKSNSAGNSDCFRVCFHLHFNDTEISQTWLFAACLLQRMGRGVGVWGGITCNHLTFALCKQLWEQGISSNLLCENAVRPLSLPQQRGCPWAEISSRAPLPLQGLCPARAHRVVRVLVEGSLLGMVGC